jgi:post-segregation antitoxin (ccd killing protein)
MATADSSTNFVIVSDHGFGSATGNYGLPKKTAMTGNHRPNGIFLAAGPDIRPGEIFGLTSFDLAPTILALLDLPVANELPGTVYTQLFRPGYFEDFPVRKVSAGHRRDWRVVRSAEPVDIAVEQDALETLKALGYISASTQASSELEHPETDFWQIEWSIRRRALLGELLFYLLRSQLVEARELVTEVHQRDGLSYDTIRSFLEVSMARMEEEFKKELFPHAKLEAIFPDPSMSGDVRP